MRLGSCTAAAAALALLLLVLVGSCTAGEGDDVDAACLQRFKPGVAARCAR